MFGFQKVSKKDKKMLRKLFSYVWFSVIKHNLSLKLIIKSFKI